MKKTVATHLISGALGLLLHIAGFPIYTWQFWAWIVPLHLMLVARDWAVPSNAKVSGCPLDNDKQEK